MIQVVNFRNRDALPEPWYYVGRDVPAHAIFGSPLGNPYRTTKGKSREEALAKYKAWLWREMNDPASEARAELHRLAKRAQEGDLYLACWCAPQSCHADIIKAAIEWLNSQ
ncbi:MAG TPA: DUF4326 domain-containing protein [Blastocatellia bacterium]|nr:DUF4326 domain-containing protein [Blastocatellia bacterium]HMY72411.1 DUF4326 domain-containing protein [Blastocatellia bacterium]HMZ20389.1 DUF4326 domain-containing protein [Blastocatellia bacterium]